MIPILSISDVIGLELDEAQDRLARAGSRLRGVTETRPPQPVTLVGSLRVVRARFDQEGEVELVVTRERYVPQLAPQ